jgi:hypothetical protein
MSGDLIHGQCEMLTNEFVDNLKSLSVSQSSNTYADAIEELHIQLKRAIPNGFRENKPFAFSVADNLYRIVPILDTILSNDNEDNKNAFNQANNFLETLSNSFKDLCLFDVFTVLQNTRPLQNIFRNYIGLVKETHFTDNNNNKYDNLINCLLPIIGISSILVPVPEDKIPSNLLTYLLTYTKQYWQCQRRENVVRNILNLIKIFSKKPTLVPMVIRAEWPHACIQWLINKDTDNPSRPGYPVDQLICLILQKVARHTIGVEVLNQLNCIKALDESHEQMKRDHTELENKCIDFLLCMIYVLLVEANEIKQLSMLTDSRMCQGLEQVIMHTIEASKNENFFYQCFHISEILSVLSKLFVNDDILKKCIDEHNELFDCLCQLIIHFADINAHINRIRLPFDDEVLLTLTNLLWSISFHQCYHEKFQKNSTLMRTLSNLATSASLYTAGQTKSIPRDLSSVKQAAEGILWNLKSSSSSLRSISTISNEKNEQQQPLAMISYSHSDAIFCRELVERLSAYVPVWVDYKQGHDAISHSDDLWEEIARAMEMATIIVLIVSKEYYDSKSCRQELSYASDALKKRIVPVYAPNQQYRASGWLGIRIAGQKYIHFGRKLFADAVKELSSMILTDQKQIGISSTTSPPPPPPPAPSEIVTNTSSKTIPVKFPEEEENKLLILKDWTTKDIRKWFDDNHIHNDLITLYADQFHTGTALIVYARHLKLFYRNEYIRIFKKYHKIFNEKTLDTLDFITFVDALYRLRTEYDPNWKIEDGHERGYDQQIPCQTKNFEQKMTWL